MSTDSINSSIMSSVKSDVNIGCSINNTMQPESFVTVTKAEDNLKMLHFTSSGFPFTTVMFDSIGFNFESQRKYDKFVLKIIDIGNFLQLYIIVKIKISTIIKNLLEKIV